jgi:hypothetical protein
MRLECVSGEFEEIFEAKMDWRGDWRLALEEKESDNCKLKKAS